MFIWVHTSKQLLFITGESLLDEVHGDGSLWQAVTNLATYGKKSPFRTRARCNLQEPAHSHQLLTRRLHLRSLELSIQNASLAKEDISYSNHNLPLAPKGSSHLIMKTAFKATWRVPKVLVVSRLFKSPTSFLRFIINTQLWVPLKKKKLKLNTSKAQWHKHPHSKREEKEHTGKGSTKARLKPSRTHIQPEGSMDGIWYTWRHDANSNTFGFYLQSMWTLS